jgi:hypothetical protein
MRHFAAALIFASFARAQNPQTNEIAEAVKSPVALAHYIEAHSDGLDWDAVWKALGTPEPKRLYPFCGDRLALAYSCSTEIVSVVNPDQTILIAQSSGVRSHDIYLRYLQQAEGDWRFTGAYAATLHDDSLRRHEIERIGSRPFLRVASDLSQVGGGFVFQVEDWFDLTRSGLEPVFSFTSDGSFGFGDFIRREVHGHAYTAADSGVDRITVTLSVGFALVDRALGAPEMYSGVYERGPADEKFHLRSARMGGQLPTDGKPMPVEDFETLQGLNFQNERALVHTLGGLKQVATGSDPEPKKWLRSLLDKTRDTPEKRELLQLLGN